MQAITAPATTLSAIAVEAYKKWILCCLIAYGRLDDLPNYTRHAVSGRLESHAQLYKVFIAISIEQPSLLFVKSQYGHRNLQRHMEVSNGRSSKNFFPLKQSCLKR